MNAHRVETTIAKDRTLLLQDLPFGAGQAVEVIVLASDENPSSSVAAKQSDMSANEWETASHAALKGVWDNEDDAVYDNLRSK